MNLLDFLIPAAHAQATGAPPAGLGGMSLLFPIVLIAVTSEAAVPAIWPIGSNAMALRLPRTRPAIMKTLVVHRI